MKIIRLKLGERAPDNSDRIIIEHLPSGRYSVRAVTADRLARKASFVTISERSLGDDGEAESDGIRWAMRQPIDVLYVERANA